MESFKALDQQAEGFLYVFEHFLLFSIKCTREDFFLPRGKIFCQTLAGFHISSYLCSVKTNERYE